MVPSRHAAVPAAVARLATAKGIGPAQLRRIVAALRTGRSKQSIHRDEAIGYERLDVLARALGWRRDWLAASVWAHRRLIRIAASEILARFDRGETLQKISDRAGVSRERVRQIARDAGRTGRRIAQRPAVEARRRQRERDRIRRRLELRRAIAERRAAADKRLEKQLAKANSLWHEGRSIKQIAKVYRVPANSMGWYVFTARSRLGDGWFPYRLAPRKTG